MPFECQKIAKKLDIFSKKLTILLTKITVFVNFFEKNVNGNFGEKSDNFVNFVEKNVVFGNF